MSAIERIINLNASTVSAAIAAQGLGTPTYIAIESTAPIAGDITTVSSASDVAALETATQISATAAADLTAAFSQNQSPTTIVVAAYDSATEDPTDALDRLEAGEYDFGIIAQESRSDTDNSLVGAWLAASQFRKWMYPFSAMSANADLITSGKPAALSDCEIDQCAMHYHSTASASQAAAFMGFFGGYGLINKPIGMRLKIAGVDLPNISNAEATAALANNVCILKPLGKGASASTKIIDNTRAYSGFGWSGVATMQYTIRRLLAASQALIANHAETGEPLFANTAGVGEVRGTLTPVLDELSGVGHYTPGTSGTAPNVVILPNGYKLDVTAASGIITASTKLLLGQEMITLNLNVIGEEQ